MVSFNFFNEVKEKLIKSLSKIKAKLKQNKIIKTINFLFLLLKNIFNTRMT
jgi:hypothetical protein